MCSFRPLIQIRSFHSSRTHQRSVLFALHELSNSRETHHLNKASRLRRVEHSPALKLIETSEVDPFSSPKTKIPSSNGRESGKIAEISALRPQETPSPSFHTKATHNTPAPKIASEDDSGSLLSRSKASSKWDMNALQVGRSILAEKARKITGLRNTLDKAKRRLKREREAMAERMRQKDLDLEVASRKVRSMSPISAVALAALLWAVWGICHEANKSHERKMEEEVGNAEGSRTVFDAAKPSVLFETPNNAVDVEPPRGNATWLRRLFWKE